MTSSPTTRNRLLKQGAGDNVNTWGDQQSTGDFDMIDAALDGMTQLTVSGPVTLSTANYAADQARTRSLKILAASTLASTITVAAVEKWYLVWNASSFDQILATSGGGTSVTIKAGETAFVVCDAVNMARLRPLSFTAPAAGFSFSGGPVDFGTQRLTSVATPTATTDATNKTYVDSAISSAAFSMGAFGVPIVPGDSGKFLTNNGSTPSWAYAVTTGAGLASVAGATLTVTGAAGADVQAATSTSKAVVPKALADSAAFGSLTDASTIAWEIATAGYDATVTLTASGHQVGSPTLNGGALYDGCAVLLELVQDATGGRTCTWNAVWDFGQALTPSLNTGANKRTWVQGVYRTATSKIHANAVWRSA